MAPRVFLDRVFSVHIVKTSPRFARVFHQAAQAEGQGLDEIAGPGYRKALEFLIKDYAISIGHTHADVIRSKLLGKVIDDHVADVNVKSTAKRAAWIGNDETHYDRVWEDRDIEDLKVLIELTVRWIESEKMTREYEEKMAARKPTK